MRIKKSASFLIVLFLVNYALPHQSLAHHRAEVLGVATEASEVAFPATTAGPGFFLPSSNFYFLDKLVQGIRLTVAYTPEAKAKMRSDIAQERLAELRIMLARNDEDGIDVALSELTKEAEASAEQLQEASVKGNNVTELARTLNDVIKSQRDVLTVLMQQTQGSLHLRIKAAREELKQAKITVEDQLPEDEIDREIEENIQAEIEEGVHEASQSAKGLEHAITVLSKLASQAAEKQQTRREEALLNAIDQKNALLQTQENLLLQQEQQKRDKIVVMQEQSAKEARATIQSALEAAAKFDAAQKEKERMEKSPAESFVVETKPVVQRTERVVPQVSPVISNTGQ